MAKRVNYGFGKRQKEIKRQKKKEAKAAKRQLKREGAEGNDPDLAGSETDEPSESVDNRPSNSDLSRTESG